PRPPGPGRRRRRAGRRAGRCGDRRVADRRRARLSVRQPGLGPPVPRARLRLRARDRGLQARAAAGIRLLRPAVPVRRSARRPCRPEGGSGRGLTPRPRFPPRAEGAPLGHARDRAGEGTRPAGARGRAGAGRVVKEVSLEEARRIAVRAQLLDGSATGVLDTVHRLGFLQIAPIPTVAPPQYLVLWSRLGPFDRAELDRLVWMERKLVEVDAFIHPVE